ncbi:hypothetical protein V8E54_011538 [Elaphomyces granulatus]|jgi:hypothetical protein
MAIVIRPNFIAARRFGHAILSRIGLYDSMTNALHFLLKTGDLKKYLAGYRRLMEQRDIGRSAFQKTEENHRDIIWYTISREPLSCSND